MDAVKVDILQGDLAVKARVYGDSCDELVQVSGLENGLNRTYTAEEISDLAVIFQELDIEIQRYRYKKAASAAMMDQL